MTVTYPVGRVLPEMLRDRAADVVVTAQIIQLHAHLP